MTSSRAHTLKVSALALAGLAGTAIAAVAIGPDTDDKPATKSAECTTTRTTATTCTSASQASAPLVALTSFDPDKVSVTSGGGSGGMVVVESLGGTSGSGTSSVTTTGPTSTSRSIMVRDDGTDKVKVEIKDGKTSAWINGEEVSPKQIRKTNDTITILDKNGNEVATFSYVATNKATTIFGDSIVLGTAPHDVSAIQIVPQIATGPDGAITMNVAPQLLATTGLSPFGGNYVVADPDTPPVMVGITMGDVSPELLDYLDLDGGNVFIISRVIKDLPAAKAGLQERDIVIKVDGNAPATQEGLRKILREREPGDTVKLTVIRKGEKKDIKIKLDKYDPQQLSVQTNVLSGVPAVTQRLNVSPLSPPTPPSAPSTTTAPTWVTPVQPSAPRNFGGSGGVIAPRGEHSKDVKKALEQAVEQLRDMKMQGDESTENSLKGFEEALRALEKATQALDGLEVSGRFSVELDNKDGDWRLFMGDKPDMVFRAQPDQGFSTFWHSDKDNDSKSEHFFSQGNNSVRGFAFTPEHADQIEKELDEHFRDMHEHLEKLGDLKHLEKLGDLQFLGDDFVVKLENQAREIEEATKANGRYSIELRQMRDKLDDQNKNVDRLVRKFEADQARTGSNNEMKSIKNQLDGIESDLADIKKMLKQLMEMHKQ